MKRTFSAALALSAVLICADLSAQQGIKSLETGLSFEKEGRWDQAISQYETIVAANLDPETTMQAKVRLGWIYLEQKNDLAKARPYFEDAKKGVRYPDIAAQAAVYEGQAVLKAASSEKDFEMALGNFDIVIRTYPNSPAVMDALISAGIILELQHKYGKATINYQSVISRFPDSKAAPEAFIRLGRVLGKQGDVNSALEAYQTVQLRYPGTAWANIAKDETTLLYRLFLLKKRSPAIFKPNTIAAKSNAFKLDDPGRLDWIASSGRLQLQDKERSYSLSTAGEIKPGGPVADFIDASQRPYRIVKGGLMLPGEITLSIFYIKEGDAKKEHHPYDEIDAVAVNQYGDMVVATRGQNGLFRVNRQTGETTPFTTGQKDFKAKKILVDSEGDFFVLNSEGTSLTVFDARGKQLEAVLSTAVGIKKEIADFALDPLDNIYLLDAEGQYTVIGGLHQSAERKLTSLHRQEIVEQGKPVKDLRSLSVLPNGSVFVATKESVLAFR